MLSPETDIFTETPGNRRKRACFIENASKREIAGVDTVPLILARLCAFPGMRRKFTLRVEYSGKGLRKPPMLPPFVGSGLQHAVVGVHHDALRLLRRRLLPEPLGRRSVVLPAGRPRKRASFQKRQSERQRWCKDAHHRATGKIQYEPARNPCPALAAETPVRDQQASSRRRAYDYRSRAHRDPGYKGKSPLCLIPHVRACCRVSAPARRQVSQDASAPAFWRSRRHPSSGTCWPGSRPCPSNISARLQAYAYTYIRS